MNKALLAVSMLAASLAACGGKDGRIAPLPTAAAGVPVVPVPSPSPRVVIISVDGLRGDVIGGTSSAPQADAPHIRSLAARGVYSWRAQAVVPSETLPSHASMLSGQPPSVHRQTWEEWEPRRGYIPVPTVFTLAKVAGLRTVMVVGKEKFQHLNVPGTVDAFIYSDRGDAEIASEAVLQAQLGFGLMFVHLPDTDLAGHAKGWLSPTYYERVAEADRAVGRLLAALPRGTTVIFTSDHGGKGNNHGMSIPENMNIPWILAGPRIPAGGELTRGLRTMDTAATALYVLGLAPPPSCAGNVVAEAFSTE